MLIIFTPIYCLFLCIAVSSVAIANNSISNSQALIDTSQSTVINTTKAITLWNGPTAGPKATGHKNITFIAADLRNGGIRGVAEGASEAAAKLGWSLKFIDSQGSPVKQTAALTQALHAKTDGIILGGIDAASQLPFMQSSPSDYISPTQLINQQNIFQATKTRGLYEPANNYRKAYLNIWN